MIELIVLIVFNASIMFALLYQFEKDYQKAICHLLWAILEFLIIQNMVNAG